MSTPYPHSLLLVGQTSKQKFRHYRAKFDLVFKSGITKRSFRTADGLFNLLNMDARDGVDWWSLEFGHFQGRRWRRLEVNLKRCVPTNLSFLKIFWVDLSKSRKVVSFDDDLNRYPMPQQGKNGDWNYFDETNVFQTWDLYLNLRDRLKGRQTCAFLRCVNGP